MAGTVAMTYPTVTAVARGFDAQAAMLKAISTALEGAIQVLRTAAMLGVVMAKFLADYLQGIKDAIDKLIKDCQFYAKNLDKAVNDHKTGQYDAGSYFTQGDSLGG